MMIKSASPGGTAWPKMMFLAVVVLLASSVAGASLGGGRSLAGAFDDVGCSCDTASEVWAFGFNFYTNAFCRIKRPVRPIGLGLACKCNWGPFMRCYGKTVPCLDPGTPWCDNPSNNLESCVQGGGNCRGYVNEACSCGREGNGCALVIAPQPNTACKCMAKMDADNPTGWVCMGFPVLCADSTSEKCRKPDTSRETCLEGLKSKGTGGIDPWDPDFSANCDGYPK